MSQRRKVSLATFQVIVEDCGNGDYVVSVDEFSWTVATATDGQSEIIDEPEQCDLPPRLTKKVVLAAVNKSWRRYNYSC